MWNLVESPANLQKTRRNKPELWTLVCPIYIKINSLTIMNYELSWTLSFQTAPKLSCWVVCTHPNISIRIPTIHKSFQSSQPIIPSLVRNNNLKTWNLPSQGCWNIPQSRPWKQRNWPGTSTVGKNHWSPMNFRSPALRSVFSTRLPVMAKATCIPRWQLSRTTLRIWAYLRHRHGKHHESN